MKSYQRKENKVKGSVTILDEGKLLETAASGLLNLSIELGFEVMSQMLELDVEALAGKKGKRNPDRKAYRHGYEQTKVVLGGEKRSVEKPRVRSADGKSELPLPSLPLFQNEDPLSQAVRAKLIRGVSTRKYAGTSEHPSPEGTCTSKSEVNRRFIAALGPMVAEFLSRRLEPDYPAIMIDGMNIGDMTVLAAMGIRKDGTKQMLGVVEGSSENHLVAGSLLKDLTSRGLVVDIPHLFVLDGGKALHKAVFDRFGKFAVIQRCQVHKKRNVLSHLPKSEQSNVGIAISRAYLEFDYAKAKQELMMVYNNLELRYPKAADSLLEGLEETLTVHRLKVPGLLRQSICSTNPMESANSVCMGFARRIKNWKGGDMILRNITAGFMEAEKSFHRVKGYRQIPLLTSFLYALCLPASSLILTHSA
jgi:transposase-like protein